MPTPPQLIITYPHGQGGSWLGNLLNSTITGTYNLVHPGLNFHDQQQFPHHSRIVTGHSNQVVDPDYHVWSFCSAKTQYIAYCNGYAKLRKEQIKTLSHLDQFHALTDDAVWRTSQEFDSDYLKWQCLDADLLVTAPAKFVDQMYTILDQYSIEYQADADRAVQSIQIYNQTCWGQHTLGDTNNLAWLAWCQAIRLKNCQPIPVNIATDFTGLIDLVNQQQNYFIDYTEENFFIL